VAEGSGDDIARDIDSSAHDSGGGVNCCGSDVIGDAPT